MNEERVCLSMNGNKLNENWMICLLMKWIAKNRHYKRLNQILWGRITSKDAQTESQWYDMLYHCVKCYMLSCMSMFEHTHEMTLDFNTFHTNSKNLQFWPKFWPFFDPFLTYGTPLRTPKTVQIFWLRTHGNSCFPGIDLTPPIPLLPPPFYFDPNFDPFSRFT